MTIAVGVNGSVTPTAMTAPGIRPGDRIAGALSLVYDTGAPDEVIPVDLDELSITDAHEVTVDGSNLTGRWVVLQFDKAYDNY